MLFLELAFGDYDRSQLGNRTLHSDDSWENQLDSGMRLALQKKRRIPIFAISIASLGLLTSVADTEASEPCRPFTVMGDFGQRSAEFVDFGNDGQGPDDIRIGRMGLDNEAGDTVGLLRWVCRSLDSPPAHGQSSHAYGDHRMIFEDRQIHFRYLAQNARPASEASKVSAEYFAGVVVRGTGTYRFSRGTVDATTEDYGITFALDIKCD